MTTTTARWWVGVPRDQVQAGNGATTRCEQDDRVTCQTVKEVTFNTAVITCPCGMLTVIDTRATNVFFTEAPQPQ